MRSLMLPELDQRRDQAAAAASNFYKQPLTLALRCTTCSRGWFGLCRMLLWRVRMCCGLGATGRGSGQLLQRGNAAAWAVVGLVIVLFLGNVARAQPAEPVAPPLDRSHVLRVFDPLERWLQNAGAQPEPEAEPDAEGEQDAGPAEAMEPVLATGVSAVRVELRWLGALVGAGVAESEGASKPTDVMALGRAAGQRALAELKNELAAESRPTEDDAGLTGLPARERTLARVAGRVTLSLEVAGEPVALSIPDDAPRLRVLSLISPSADGLILRHRDADRAATLWPAQATAMNLQPISQFTRLLKRTGLPTRPAWRIGRSGHGQLLTFPVIHRARGRLGVEPSFLVRGHPLVGGEHATTRQTEQLIHELSQHLSQRVRDRGTVAGRYLPSSDRYDPIDAPAHEAALVAYALARSVAVRQQLVIIEPADQSQLRARGIMRPLLHALDNSQEAKAVAPAALALMAADTLPTVLDRAAQRAVLANRFRALVKQHLPEGKEPGVGATAHAIAGAAAALHADRTGDAAWRAMATRLLDDLDTRAADPDPGWLHWRVLAQHHSPRRIARAPDVNLPKRRLGWPQLSAALSVAEATQVTRRPAVGPDDVRGGFNLKALAEGPTPNAPLPDWRSAGVVLAQAITLRQPADVAGDAVNPLDRLLGAALGVRFLNQLKIQPGSHWFIRSPASAAHGLRTAPWDNRISPACTALALLAVCEMRLAVER